jgi:DNA invertase Pin-like site-specific DNA recombinase
MKGKKAVGYARVVPEQATVKEALVHQAERIVSYCRAQELDLIQVFEETVSAEVSLSDGRDQLKQALKAVPDEGVLVVVRVDRLSSNRHILQEIQSRCNERGITVHTMLGPTDLSQVKSGIEVTVSP